MRASKIASTSSYKLEDEYTVGEELGRGAHSVIKVVNKRGAEKGVSTAVKMTALHHMWAQGLDMETLQLRQKTIAGIAAQLKSPNVVRLLEWRVTDEDFFCFVERFKEDEVRRLIWCMLTALAELHTLGLIHRDIKPDNIFFRAKDSPIDEAILGDFGISIWNYKQGQQFLGAGGSPGYISPEMAANLPYDERTDIFSLGITAYEALTGRAPLVSEDPKDLLREVVERGVTFPKRYWSSISTEAQHVVRCMVARNPDDRWTAEELLTLPWFEGLPDHLDDERLAPPVGRWSANSTGSTNTSSGTTSGGSRFSSFASTSAAATSDTSGTDPELDIIMPRLSQSSIRSSTRASKLARAADCVFDTTDLLNGLPLSADHAKRLSKLG